MASGFFERRSKGRAEMSFVDHLEELRWHIIRSILAILILAVLIFLKIQWVFDNIIAGPINPNFISYKALCDFSNWLHLGDALCLKPISVSIQTTTFGGQFFSSFSIAFIGGFIGAFPYIFWEFWRFARPALTKREQRKTKGIIFWVSLLFFMGVGFGYYLIAPYTVNFFATYTLSPLIANTFTVGDYIDNIVSLVLGTGIVFQLPLVVLFLSKIGLLTPAFLRSNRKYAFVIILIIAAVITPPDVVSQMIVTVPILLLYEISIWISAKTVKELDNEQEREDDKLEEWS